MCEFNELERFKIKKCKSQNKNSLNREKKVFFLIKK